MKETQRRLGTLSISRQGEDTLRELVKGGDKGAETGLRARKSEDASNLACG